MHSKIFVNAIVTIKNSYLQVFTHRHLCMPAHTAIGCMGKHARLGSANKAKVNIANKIAKMVFKVMCGQT